MTKIEVAELMKINELYALANPFESILPDALMGEHRGKEQLVHRLANYAHFNSVFVGGVASLVGQVHTRPECFFDKEEPLKPFADKSGEIASHIFFAAIDEYRTPIYRVLAKRFVRETAAFYDVNSSDLEKILSPTPATVYATQQVRSGYLVNRVTLDGEILGAIGFHIGSEFLAVDEFTSLDNRLRTLVPKLVNSLGDAYTWVAVHTTVEVEHTQRAIAAAELAIRYSPRPDAKKLILGGFVEFAQVRADFFQQLKKLRVSE